MYFSNKPGSTIRKGKKFLDQSVGGPTQNPLLREVTRKWHAKGDAGARCGERK